MRMIIVLVTLAALGGGAAYWYWQASSKQHVEFRTVAVKRGDLLATISATGALEPVESVDVGAQVPGQIVSFGKDVDGKTIDNRSRVKGGDVLARIDDTTYRADLETAGAQLDQAKAAVQKSQADLELAQAKLDQARQSWARAEKIGPSDALSQNDYDMYKADFASAQANVHVAIAQIAQAKTVVLQSQSAVNKAQRNFEFCTIKSPVDGVIIQRRVNVGQTVVASLNTPSLFLIATDLSKMQIWVAVNEADIGHITPGQNVTFTTDAFTGQTFKGSVNKVRLYATMTQNVVTYTVEVNCDNPGNKLVPYLTANVQFEVQKDANVLLVPNAALRWYPGDANEVAPEARSQWKPVASESEGPKNPDQPRAAKPARDKKPAERKGMVWVSDGTFVRPVQLRVGPTDGINTEVAGEGLGENQQVVVGEVAQVAQDGQERNPFLPQIKHR